MEFGGRRATDRLSSIVHAAPETWLAWSAWVAIAITVLALVYLHRQLQRNRRVAVEQSRPHVTVFMEPNAADWYVIELVVRNFGKTPAYDVAMEFPNPPNVARYETASDGFADVVALELPDALPVLGSGQEWRVVWDSAIDRRELGEAIESRFTGTVSYFDGPAQSLSRWARLRSRMRGEHGRTRYTNEIVLDWKALPPVRRLELLTTHNLAKQEKQKLELLRDLMTYFHYAAQETRPDVFSTEAERIKRAARQVRDRLAVRDGLSDASEGSAPRTVPVSGAAGRYQG